MNNNVVKHVQYAPKNGHLGLRLPLDLIGELKIKATSLGFKNVSEYIRSLVVREVQNGPECH